MSNSILATLVGGSSIKVEDVFASILKSFLVALHEEGKNDHQDPTAAPEQDGVCLHLPVDHDPGTLPPGEYGTALQEKALSLGWSPEQIQLIGEDLGLSGSSRSPRQGFQRLVAQVSLGQVGAIFGLEVSRRRQIYSVYWNCALCSTLLSWTYL